MKRDLITKHPQPPICKHMLYCTHTYCPLSRTPCVSTHTCRHGQGALGTSVPVQCCVHMCTVTHNSHGRYIRASLCTSMCPNMEHVVPLGVNTSVLAVNMSGCACTRTSVMCLHRCAHSSNIATQVRMLTHLCV